MSANGCVEQFVVNVLRYVDTEIMVYGESISQVVRYPGQSFDVYFCYMLGDPPATGPRLEWTARLYGSRLPSEARPSYRIMTMDGRRYWFAGTSSYKYRLYEGWLQGTLPLVEGVTYTGTLTMEQE